MPLEGLLKLVETLSSRIDEHGDTLRQSEALTRYALINPLLRELGWDTADPAHVIPEYRSGGGRADYALLSGGKPAVMVEAKSLGTSLRDAVLSQGINYCLMEGTKHFAVTDGQCWEIYETHRPVPIDEKRIIAFDLKGQSPAAESLKALALWRAGVESGHVAAAQVPVVETIQDQPTPMEPSASSPQPTTPRPDEHEWKPLSELDPQPGFAPPVEVQFPDGSVAPVTAWNSILVEAVRWLINGNYLNAGHLPIQTPNSVAYRVSASPAHSSGNQFHSHEQIGMYHVKSMETSDRSSMPLDSSSSTLARPRCSSRSGSPDAAGVWTW